MDTLVRTAVDTLEQWRDDYPAKREDKPEGVFEFGLCMAGAVSAGAYTAGVLDVLIEALDAFTAERERRLAAGEPPLHEVRLPVLGGASAGGMCAAIAAIFLDARFPPVRPDTPPAERRKNPLYRAWVTDIDIRHLLGTEDMKNGGLQSLLDSTVLEHIVDDLLDERTRMDPARRPWLTTPLRAVLTLTNLRGVPYKLAFSGSQFSHWMSHHADHARFAIDLAEGAGATPDDPVKIGETRFNRFAPRKSIERDAFKEVALGTGSFPVMLAPRVVRRPVTDYLYRAALTPSGPFTRNEELVPHPAWAACVAPTFNPAPDPYAALCVDGGAMNNEPLDLVRRVLAGYHSPNPRLAAEARRAVLLIDPFVNPGKPGPDAAKGLVGSILPLFSALVANSRFKPEDLALAADPAIGSRFVVAPSRGSDWEAEGAIAAGHLGGFLGFFAEAYRRHDFLLGRYNTLNFLRRHFVLPDTNELFGPRWSDDDKRHWGVECKGAPNRHLPIIPLCGALHGREEPLPEWPAGAFSVEEVAPLVERRAEVVVPALRDSLLSLLLSENGARQSGVKPWLIRQGTAALTSTLTAGLVRKVVKKIEAEARRLDSAHRVS